MSLVYCPGTASAGAFLVAGLIEIGGQPATAGTLVSVFFNGVQGPTGTVTEAGAESGYRVQFAVDSEQGCANRPGEAIALVVAGTVVSTPLTVPQQSGSPLLRFDVSIP